MNAQPTAATTRPITRVLVANRGEISRRIFAACRVRGIGTAAVFSDADEHAAFVAEADAAVRLPGTSPAETYLRGDLVIAAAQAMGADAIHPGYGFLSENADFAQDVIDAGLVWIGPDPESIVQMGSKVESKRLMEEAGVPVLKELDPDTITETQLPVLVKASSGGGGRGMRVVDNLDELSETVAAASREAASAFGDSTVFCERYIPTGHHIEVQVFGDRAGTAWAVGERECSIQRRHQKVVEEAPAPLVERHGSVMRERLYEAARNAVTRIGYVGAGTVEFLADADGSFYFLEMNTRLQVEHPVTECTTGLDLVGLQLDLAMGGKLDGEEPSASGHSIEVRLYAEDPADDWAPQAGPVHAFDIPGAEASFTIPDPSRPTVRVDAGLEAGESISTFYDPMIAKVIGTAPTRQAAARVLASSLERMSWDGPTTNADLLVRVLREEDFLRGDTATSYLPEHPRVFDRLTSDKDLAIAAIAAALAAAASKADGAVVGPDDVVSTGEVDNAEHALAAAIATDNPRPLIGGWRLFHPDWRSREFTSGGGDHLVEYRQRRDRWEVRDASVPEGTALKVISVDPATVRLSIDSVERRFTVTRSELRVVVTTSAASITLVEAERFTDPQSVIAPGSLLAPMPGTVIRVGVAAGDAVAAGQKLIWLEAMKMEHAITTDAPGIVDELRVAEGDQVDMGMLLAVIAEASEDADSGAAAPEGAAPEAAASASKETTA